MMDYPSRGQADLIVASTAPSDIDGAPGGLSYRGPASLPGLGLAGSPPLEITGTLPNQRSPTSAARPCWTRASYCVRITP